MSQPILSIRDSSGSWIPIPAIQGEQGLSPTVAVADISGGHRVTITDAAGDHSYDVMDSTEADSGWIQPGTGLNAKYRSVGKRVSVRLGVGSGAYLTGDSAVTVLTLPEGYRPGSDLYFTGYSKYNEEELPVVLSVSASTGVVTVKKAPWSTASITTHQVQNCEFSFMTD